MFTNPVIGSRRKHIHFGLLKVSQAISADQVADNFTKQLGSSSFTTWRTKLQVWSALELAGGIM